jgi:hypothetical protein
MAGKGGAREGAGRKSNAEKYGVQIAEYTDRCAEFLDDAQEKLRELIEGATRSECKRARAGTVTRKDVVRDEDGEPIADKNGKLTVIEIKVFPDLPDDEMVIVEERTISLPPDLRAIECLTDRVCGRPIPSEELAPDPADQAINPMDLESLPIEDLDALESIARKIAEGGPGSGSLGDRRGEDAAS